MSCEDPQHIYVACHLIAVIDPHQLHRDVLLLPVSLRSGPCNIDPTYASIIAMTCMPKSGHTADWISDLECLSGPSAFSMHVMTVRRAGAAASKPQGYMLVTSPAGAVLHVTEAFATLLGTTSKVRGMWPWWHHMMCLNVQHGIQSVHCCGSWMIIEWV